MQTNFLVGKLVYVYMLTEVNQTTPELIQALKGLNTIVKKHGDYEKFYAKFLEIAYYLFSECVKSGKVSTGENLSNESFLIMPAQYVADGENYCLFGYKENGSITIFGGLRLDQNCGVINRRTDVANQYMLVFSDLKGMKELCNNMCVNFGDTLVDEILII